MGQYKALTKKNWILWKRNLCGNIIQILVPLAFLVVMIAIRKLVYIEDYVQQSFVGNPLYDKSINGLPSTITANQAFLKMCRNGYVVALTPAGSGLINALNTQLTNIGYVTEIFDSDEQVNKRARDIDYGKPGTNRICFGISIKQQSAGIYKYSIRFNQTIDNLRTQVPATTLKLQLDQALNLNLYRRSINFGAVGATVLVNSMILNEQSPASPTTISSFLANVSPIYQQSYQLDDLFRKVGKFGSILFLLPLLVVYLRMTSSMLAQKQRRIRYTMLIMGMRLPIYFATWFQRYLITYLIIHIIGSGVITAVFPHIPYFTMLLTFVLFDFVLLTQSMFIQVFFSKAKIGVIIALVFFLFQYIISFVSTNSENPTLQVNTALAIVPHAAFVLAVQSALFAESAKTDWNFTEEFFNFKLNAAMVSFACNIVFWFLLTMYLEQVFPTQYGSKKHPLWCCFGRGKKREEKQEDQKENNFKYSSNPNFQPALTSSQPQNIINLTNLTKHFSKGDTTAVDNLNIKMYNDNIFVLLGHNGAGKTTTISMLTGMLDPSEGSIQVLGKTEVNQIRKTMGICPQHDTLYEKLTVREHLELFGSLKGLQGEQVEQQVIKLICDVNLAQKQHYRSANLSGGQKRRLSVAIAFAGRSKVIILDQPTSGMDTSARRYIWELLRGYKKDRIILLTTHFMDQADYLGDRIGIMAGGRMVTCGSGLFLKNRFGVGYNITFVTKAIDDKNFQKGRNGGTKGPQMRRDSQESTAKAKRQSIAANDNIANPYTRKIISAVQKHVPRATILSNVSSEISMQLPMDQVGHFPALFKDIDSKLNQLGIETYGISITTLEEVFLKVADEREKPVGVGAPNSNIIVNGTQRQLIQTTNNQQQFSQQQPTIQRIQSEYSRFWLHFKATLLKRFRVIRKDCKSFILQLLLPMILIVLALLLMKVSFIKDLPDRELSLKTYAGEGGVSPLLLAVGSGDGALLNNVENAVRAKYTASEIAIRKDNTSAVGVANFDKNFLFPLKQTEKLFMGGVFISGQSTTPTQKLYKYTTITNTKIPTSLFYLQTLAAQSLINHYLSKNISITLTKSPLPRTYGQLQINNTISGFFAALVFSIALGFKFASIISFIVKQRSDRSKHQQIVSGMNVYAYWIGNFCYDFIMYLVLAGFSIVMIVALDVSALNSQDGSLGPVVVAFLLYGLSYIPLTYIAGYLFDDYGNAQAGFYFFTFIVGGLLSTVVLVLRIINTGNASEIGKGIAWVLRLSPAYCFGQILSNLGSIYLLSLGQLGLGLEYGVWDINISLLAIIYLIVEFVFFTFLVFFIEKLMNNEKFMRYWTSEANVEQTQRDEDSDVIDERERALKAKPEQYEILTKRLRKVYMLGGSKQVKHKVAVDNLSFGIQKGEVFGLLGVNGAGKTTTFKMLAGQVTSTKGDSFFTGLQISENLQKVRENLGYCPQFDALIDNLTVRQQIELFYDLKSLIKDKKDNAVSRKIRQMDLTDYQNKLSGTLSGGNKRKLSVAMAMIGNPHIIFLDEPSTGMDPKARRFMWKVISRIASQKKQSTIILTTHSMQEAQALSTRLAIMVGGGFKCIGTPQHIKSKFGEGYEIEIKLTPCTQQQVQQLLISKNMQGKATIIARDELEGFLASIGAPKGLVNQIGQNGAGKHIHNQFISQKSVVDRSSIVEFVLTTEKVSHIQNWVRSKFGSCQIIENFQTFIRLKVNGKMSVGNMFEALQNEKKKIGVETYSIRQATVEQIFNRFAEDGDEGQMN